MKKSIAIIGGGASALMLGCCLDPAKYKVTIYEKNAALGRKFLVAGDGGFNLTHSEAPEKFITRYTPYKFLETAFGFFSNIDLVNWLEKIGIPTFTGSSGRIFPEKGIKPIEVLNAFLKVIEGNSVIIQTQHEWEGFAQNQLIINNRQSRQNITPDITVFCLGGASWPVTGSKGDWLHHFNELGIRTFPFRASNCSFTVNWDKKLADKIEGKAIKNIVIKCGGHEHAGEIIITHNGIEGSGIYPLSPSIRHLMDEKGYAEIFIDLKPTFSKEKILSLLDGSRNMTGLLRDKIKLNNASILLVKSALTKEEFLNKDTLTEKIKRFRITITGTGPLNDAISTVGGISLSEIDENFMLKKLPDRYCIGEMLDYDAPTGGYLLQSCFSMTTQLAHHLNNKH